MYYFIKFDFVVLFNNHVIKIALIIETAKKREQK